jgi:integrase
MTAVYGTSALKRSRRTNAELAALDETILEVCAGEHPATVRRVFYPARQAAGRPDLRWHDLRHLGAVLAASTGASLAELMARLGHSTPQAAMRYQHASRGRDKEIAAALSKIAEVKT